MKNRTKAIRFLILALLLGVFAVWAKMYVQATPPYIGFARFQSVENILPVQKAASDYVTYKGKNGKDALTLLKEDHNWFRQDKSGLVVGINGRDAETSKHEYWAFYVNGKLATVGPAQYITKNTDMIVWKIEHY